MTEELTNEQLLLKATAEGYIRFNSFRLRSYSVYSDSKTINTDSAKSD
jgi:hypothetical protein